MGEDAQDGTDRVEEMGKDPQEKLRKADEAIEEIRAWRRKLDREAKEVEAAASWFREQAPVFEDLAALAEALPTLWRTGEADPADAEAFCKLARTIGERVDRIVNEAQARLAWIGMPATPPFLQQARESSEFLGRAAAFVTERLEEGFYDGPARRPRGGDDSSKD